MAEVLHLREELMKQQTEQTQTGELHKEVQQLQEQLAKEQAQQAQMQRKQQAAAEAQLEQAKAQQASLEEQLQQERARFEHETQLLQDQARAERERMEREGGEQSARMEGMSSELQVLQANLEEARQQVAGLEASSTAQAQALEQVGVLIRKRTFAQTVISCCLSVLQTVRLQDLSLVRFAVCRCKRTVISCCPPPPACKTSCKPHAKHPTRQRTSCRPQTARCSWLRLVMRLVLCIIVCRGKAATQHS